MIQHGEHHDATRGAAGFDRKNLRRLETSSFHVDPIHTHTHTHTYTHTIYNPFDFITMIIFVNKKQRNLRYNSKHTVVIIYRKIVLFYFILFYYLCILLEEYQSVPFYIHLLETSMNKGGSCSSRDRFTSLTNDDDLAVCSSSKHRCSHTVLVSRHVINDNIEVNNWNFYIRIKNWYAVCVNGICCRMK